MKYLPPATLGDRLREARLGAGFETAGDAARALGVAAPTYHAHENGGRTPKGPAIVAYAGAFGVSVEWLLSGEAPQPADPSGPRQSQPAQPEETAGTIAAAARAAPITRRPTPGATDDDRRTAGGGTQAQPRPRDRGQIQPGPNQSGTTQRPTKKPQTKPPQTKQPQTKQPQTKQPQTKQPQSKQPQSKQPPTKQSQTKPQRKPLGYHTLGGRAPRIPLPVGPPPPPAPLSVIVPIRAEARRGHFIDPNVIGTNPGSVTVELPPDDDPRQFFALRVADASMDLHYPQGSVVVCRRYSQTELAETLKSGDHVAVRTRFAGLEEYTVCEIRKCGPTLELHFHSTDGRLAGSVDFNPDQPPAGQSANPFSQQRREILGIVLADLKVK